MRIIGFFFLLFLSSFATAEEIEAVVGWDKPPYVFQKSNTGFEVELVRQILADLGHELVPIYVPFGRTTMMINERRVDMGLTMSKAHDIDHQLLSRPYVVYQNVAVSLASRKIKIENIDDLSSYSILAFQTASNVLGDDFARSVANSKGYIEVPIQRRQMLMLLSGSVDVAVMDRNIFTYMKNLVEPEHKVETRIHEIFTPIPCSVAILDEALRNAFNERLLFYIKSGKYQALLDQFGLVNLLDRIPEYQ